MKYKSSNKNKYKWIAKINFIGDYQKICKAEIENRGLTCSSLEKAPLEFQKLLKHQISSLPRQVIKADCFVCPSGYELALKEFENKIISGDDLSPFLTEKYDNDVNYNDDLLNDWNIFHFHLTRRFKQSGKAQRSCFLIMAFITDNYVYFLKVTDHNDQSCFCDKEMLEIIHRNWPHLLKPFEIKGIADRRLDNEDIKNIRKSNVNGSVTLDDGTLLIGPGGGCTMDGSSLIASFDSIILLQDIKSKENLVIKNVDNFIEAYIRQYGQNLDINFDFVMISLKGKILKFIEKTNNITFLFDDNGFSFNKDKIN